MPADKPWASIREAGHDLLLFFFFYDLLIKNEVQELACSPGEGQMGG